MSLAGRDLAQFENHNGVEEEDGIEDREVGRDCDTVNIGLVLLNGTSGKAIQEG